MLNMTRGGKVGYVGGNEIWNRRTAGEYGPACFIRYANSSNNKKEGIYTTANKQNTCP